MTGLLGSYPSALKYKENVKNLTPEETSIIYKLRPVKFHYKNEPEFQEVGFIADEVFQHEPRVVYTKDGDVEGMHYDRLVPHLVAEIQSLNQRLLKLESFINNISGNEYIYNVK